MQPDPTKIAGNLLHTKLMPPRLHAGLILRGDLLNLLDEALGKRLTFINAPTGYGKSTLVSMWITTHQVPSAWVALDENDNDPVRFWTYVITALRTIDPSLGKTTLAGLTAAQPASLQAVLTPLINDLSGLTENCVLVLEDYQAITATQINETVAFLIQNLPATLHLVLISRSEPALPLAILRARDELLEIDASRLRFTPAETGAFLRQAVPAELPAAAVARLQERTEGWVAGLRLLTLSLQNKGGLQHAEQFIQTFSGSHRYVADYLIREVFENQPEPIRAFLLKTCFLDRLTGSLCDQVVGASGGEAILEQLERDNLFIVQLEHGAGRVWYRYNPLFAESIQYLARQRLGEAGIAALYERASAWYEYHQFFAEAVAAALSARQFERALALIEKFIEIHYNNEMRTLDHWLQMIPTDLILQRPEVCLTYAQVILYSSDRYAPSTAARIEPFLCAAEKIWGDEHNDARLGEVLCLRGMIVLWQGDFPKAFDYNRRALLILPEYDVFWRGVSLLNAGFEELNSGRIWSAQDRILEAKALLGASQNIHGVLAANQMLGDIFYWQGDQEQSLHMNQQLLLDAVGGEEMLDDQAAARMALANIAYEQNDLPAAGQYAREAIELAERRSNETLQAQAVVRLAHIQAAQGDPDQALTGLKTFTSGLQNPALLREVLSAQALISIHAGDTQAVSGWLALVEGDQHPVLHLQAESEAFTLARLWILEGKLPAALALLPAWQKDALENGRVRSQTEALLLEALAYFAAADLPRAGQALNQALSIAHAKGFRRLLLDEGIPLAALIQAALPGITRRPLAVYAAALLHLFHPQTLAQREPGSGLPILVEPLSAQELRVLRLLVAGLSNLEISRELVVSPNTVKTHIANLFAKLEVSRRTQAVGKARDLSLIP
jgi:LuxR family transcriptional regulator, maltose regulon positive regulatory protein